ncbi:hypothetical protein BOTBODRAFT_141870 [Botryobasidium botryosum FD-172 SS1]|uniref:DASH complex subunit DUO1 n=1 Tax=Botryobasidium botryosum (strain FD-172 SS1) TaxID=930990 RepID=A0A067NCJ3_BOTB1|nr:hypothetical protein BOTBODRAFT_141870 [Botryobasidium botryosum FD-172 SS1]
MSFDDSFDSAPSTPTFNQKYASQNIMDMTPPSMTGHGGADLSLSELSLQSDLRSDASTREGGGPSKPPRFSLFAQSPVHSEPQTSYRAHDDDAEEGFVEASDLVTPQKPRTHDRGEGSSSTALRNSERPTSPAPEARRATHATREDRLRATLYSMRKLNASFNEYLEAFQAAQAHNHRLATKVDQTSQLLDRYVAILGQTEHTAKLLLNPEWEGAEADELLLWKEAQEARKEQIRQEKERARLEELERERIENEKREREEREEREKREREAPPTRGRGRGRVRASGVPSSAVRGRAPSSSSLNNKRPPSVTSTRSSAIPVRGRGRGRGTAS